MAQKMKFPVQGPGVLQNNLGASKTVKTFLAFV